MDAKIEGTSREHLKKINQIEKHSIILNNILKTNENQFCVPINVKAN